MAKHIETGLRGEDVAVQYLEENGFRILERRYQCLGTDIDVIALSNSDQSIRFVEVKSRTERKNVQSEYNGNPGVYSDFSPVVAVTANRAKCNRMVAAAEYYMQIQEHWGEIGIDLIAVTWHADGVLAKVSYYADILR